MPNIALSEARVKALRPRLSTYHIRAAKLGGFGVRVLPSGAKRFFIHTRHPTARAACSCATAGRLATVDSSDRRGMWCLYWEHGHLARMDNGGPAAYCGQDARAWGHLAANSAQP